MASSTSSSCGGHRSRFSLARQWYGHFAGFSFQWTRLGAPWAVLAAFLGGVPLVAALAVAPVGAALYALSYVLLRLWVRVPLSRLKLVDTALLVLVPLLAAALLGGPFMPALGLAGAAWYINWWHGGSRVVPGAGELPEPPTFTVQPVRGRITAGYREYDLTHNGVDIGAPVGTPVVAPAAGFVLHAGPLEHWGYAVYLDHGGGWSTLFAHLERPAVRRGASVRVGEAVGWSGTSGISTGPHVHVELRYRGMAVDPAACWGFQIR
ncbi:MAG TPA: M23 family metallopeptidase [Symbiobacteriaceae bacterium]|nr:M23 family metallopeptidase [Symbiobacteriaceae bacterium]